MKLTLPEGNFAAYLFDCDGTIADTMPIHYKAWLKSLSAWNCDFPLDLFYAWAGIPTMTIVSMLSEKFKVALSAEQVAHDKEQYYLSLISEVKPIESVLWHIKHMHGKLPFAVVSGSPKESVVKSLDVIGILDRFDIIVAEGDYRQGKPHPEPYLTAARLLNIEPERCLVFEDAELGIQSAKAAGMGWVFVPQPKTI